VEITVSRALPAEYPVILNNLPPGWFEPAPHLLHLQIAEMVNAQRFLIAYTESKLVGTLGWQDQVAFGALYAKFLYVKPEYRRQAVEFRLGRELVNIAMETGQRAVFADVPVNSPVIAVLEKVPGCRKAGEIESFQENGVTSVIFHFELGKAHDFIHYADRLITAAGKGS